MIRIIELYDLIDFCGTDMTIGTDSALHRIVEGYISLGLINEAKATAAVLGYNFPDSEWYESTYDLINDFLQ